MRKGLPFEALAKEGFAPIILIGAVLVIIVAILGYLYYRVNYAKKSPNQAQTIQSNGTPSPAPEKSPTDETVN